MIKIITEQYYSIENSVNTWLKENEGKVEIQKITQSSCYHTGSTVHVTVMIEYVELITNFGSSYPSLEL
jgi:D-alanyl-D-alanine dipeptidase